jgi:hypothetical protein
VPRDGCGVVAGQVAAPDAPSSPRGLVRRVNAKTAATKAAAAAMMILRCAVTGIRALLDLAVDRF